jgi:phosphoglycerol transferase MdoB-like AlkP superfamily enzyme
MNQFMLKKICAFFFPDKANRRLILLFFLLFFFKFLWFDFTWCNISTFRPFSYFETYLFAAFVSLILLIPLVMRRMIKTTCLISVALDLLLIANLIYFRTYNTAIPLSSYGLLGNMQGYSSSITGSLYWSDIIFPVLTVIAMFLQRKAHNPPPEDILFVGSRYFLLLLVFTGLSFIVLTLKGGFYKAYEKLQDSYTHTCGTPIYTIAGSLCYDYIRDKEVFSGETGAHIENWLQDDMALKNNDSVKRNAEDTRTDCIIILAESLESWVLEKTVENQEIMPCLNKLLRDSTTFYASKVLSQVRGGRSIDAQLMINTGLLPINTGVYSLKYPNSYYPSLKKAMKEKYDGNASSRILTADKPMTWNQNVIAASFGFDSLISQNCFVQDEKVGPHYRHQLGDMSLLRQCAEKIKSREVWSEGANFVQIVTYSGHFPIVLPEHLRKLKFTDEIPSMLRDYMTVAHYTDEAIGRFIEELRQDSLFRNTLIVITGDHEGLMEQRDDLYHSAKGREIVSPDPFVPLIMLNMPESFRNVKYNKVMGQIDIYPTLCELLGLSGYKNKGLGSSVLNVAKVGIAINPHGTVFGDTVNVAPAEIQHLKEAWKVSDEIIKYDYFSMKTYTPK